MKLREWHEESVTSTLSTIFCSSWFVLCVSLPRPPPPPFLPSSPLCIFPATSNPLWATPTPSPTCTLFNLPGGEALHEDRVQMPRTVGLLHLTHVLEEDASLPGGGRPAAGALQRRLQGDGRQRRQDPHPRRPQHQAAGQAGPDLLGRVARLLRGQPEDGLAGDAGTHLQQHGHGHQRLRPAVLRARLPGGDCGVRGELSVSLPLVLRGPVQEMCGPKGAQHLSVMNCHSNYYSATFFLLFWFL